MSATAEQVLGVSAQAPRTALNLRFKPTREWPRELLVERHEPTSNWLSINAWSSGKRAVMLTHAFVPQRECRLSCHEGRCYLWAQSVAIGISASECDQISKAFGMEIERS